MAKKRTAQHWHVTWVASKISGAAGALGAEAIELRNWLLCFRFSLEEFRVVVADMANCMANSYPPGPLTVL